MIKKNSILMAAAKLFTTNGYSGTSMEQIAKAAPVSKATLYAYFSSKDELLSEVIKYLLEVGSVEIPTIDIALSDIELTLVKYINDVYNYYSNHTVIDLYRLLISEVKRFPDIFEMLFADNMGKLTKELNNYLAKVLIVENSDELLLLASQILDLVRGVSLWVSLVQNPTKQLFLNNKKSSLDGVLRNVLVLLNNFKKKEIV